MKTKRGHKTKADLQRELRSVSRRLARLQRVDDEGRAAQVALRERIKELTCLSAVDRTIETDPEPPALADEVIGLLVGAMESPDATEAQLTVDGIEVATAGFRDIPGPRLRADIRSMGRVEGSLVVVRRGLRPFLLPFEQSLVDGVASRIGAWLDRRRVLRELRENEARFRGVTEHTVSGIIIIQGDRLAYVNPAMSAITGYDEAELLEMRYWEPFHPDAHDFIRSRGAARQRGVSAPSRYEVQLRTKAGEDRWVEYVDGYIQYGGSLAVIGTIFDITDRKRAEEELLRSQEQLRLLSARIEQVRDEEKSTIARDVHDGFGQELTAIRMNLALLVDRLDAGEALRPNEWREELTSTIALVDRSIQTVRAIATELKPWVVDAMDLQGAIEWQAGEFQHRTGIRCEVTTSGAIPDLERSHRHSLFRIFQEALTNVARHAHARQVEVNIQSEQGALVLRIRDDGRGVTPEEIERKTSLGFVSMRERAAFLDGDVKIAGTTGRGTTITVRIPVDASASDPLLGEGR